MDAAMTVILMLLMAFELIGRTAHEWLGKNFAYDCAYWGFVLMSLHLGIHWNMMMGMARGKAKPSPKRAWTARAVGVIIAIYGIYAFIKRDIGIYMLLQSAFVFFDYEEPLILFYIDYIAVMGLFIWIGHYAAKILRKISSH